MSAYYSEFDPFAAAWLRELIKQGLIADGIVDERSIVEVNPEDLKEFTQCHFFAGIGVWSYALRQSGWEDDRPVWTGSCPCQPFSSAGKNKGFDDERHLWPEFYRLIKECRPATCFGEQVASKPGLAWLDNVQADLEDANYAFGSADLCAAGVGAPHIRQRLYWVSHSTSTRLERPTRESVQGGSDRSTSNCSAIGVADTKGTRRGILNAENLWTPNAQVNTSTDSSNSPINKQQRPTSERPGPANGFWRDADWLLCRDGKWRAVEPGTFPLAHGSPARVGRLRGYGNAINAEQAKAFIKAYMEIM